MGQHLKLNTIPAKHLSHTHTHSHLHARTHTCLMHTIDCVCLSHCLSVCWPVSHTHTHTHTWTYCDMLRNVDTCVCKVTFLYSLTCVLHLFLWIQPDVCQRLSRGQGCFWRFMIKAAVQVNYTCSWSAFYYLSSLCEERDLFSSHKLFTEMRRTSRAVCHSCSIKHKPVGDYCLWAHLSSATSTSLNFFGVKSLHLDHHSSVILSSALLLQPCAPQSFPACPRSGPYMAGLSKGGATGLNILPSSKNAKLLQLTWQWEMPCRAEGHTMGTCSHCLISISIFWLLCPEVRAVRCTQEC